MNLDLPHWATLAIAVIVWIGASARLTRMATQDSFPPSAWLRSKWDAHTERSGWNPLLHCHWCLAPWVVAILGVWGWFSGLHWSWWILCVWLSAGYAASWVVHRDED